MSYYTAPQMNSFSAFDEALERQKQPLLNERAKPSSSSLCESKAHSSVAQFLCSLMLLQPTKPSSSQNLPYWSTKYRNEDETFRDDDDGDENEVMMIETIDFVNNGTTGSKTSSKLEWGKSMVNDDDDDDELHIMYFTTGTTAMTSEVTKNRLYYAEREVQRRTQIIGVFTTIIAVVVFIHFVGVIIFA